MKERSKGVVLVVISILCLLLITACTDTARDIRVIYVLNGGYNHELNVSKLALNDEVILYSPTKDGSRFDGWYDNAEFEGDALTRISADADAEFTIYAKWTPIYNIAYILFGATNNPNNFSTVEIGNELILLDLENDFNDFEGWYDNENFSGSPINKLDSTHTTDITLYAKWSQFFNIEYSLDGGTNNQNNLSKVFVGSAYILSDPIKDDHVFSGWYDNSTFEGDPIVVLTNSSNIMLYAKWTRYYTINYNIFGGGDFIDNPNTIFNTDVVELKEPIKLNHVFDGWYDNIDFEGDPITVLSNTTSDVTLYAKWRRYYSVTYYLQDGTNIADNPNTIFNTDVVELKEPIKLNHVFDGWYDNIDFEGDPITVLSNTTSDITLYAKWTKILAIIYHLDGGYNNIDNENTILQGATLNIADPFKPNHVFRGWYLDAAFNSGKQTQITGETEDITFFAKWERFFTISYILNSGENDSDNPELYFLGETFKFKDAFKERYLFVGWYEDISMQGTPLTHIPSEGRDLVLHAKFLFKNLNIGRLDIQLENNKPLSEVTREVYVNARISLTQTEKEFVLEDVPAEFKGRGNGSWSQAKKGYRIKFNSKQSVFGNEKSKHWAIIPGQSDETMLRNPLAYHIVNSNLNNIEYTTSVNWVEVYVNGEYRGVYLFAEHIRVDKGRVDIDSDYGVEDTGYLIEYDAYAESEGEENVFYFKVDGLKYPFTLKSPDPEEYADEGFTKEQFKAQVAYIKDYMQAVVTAILAGDYQAFSELADINSFVDMYIIHELFKNTDTGWSSFYFYKKPGGKLYCGPTWDFDLSAGKTRGDASYTGLYVADKVQVYSNHTSSEIYIALMKNNDFIQAVKQRWSAVSIDISKTICETINHILQYGIEFQGEVNKWYSGKVWINEVINLKNWLLNRIIWLDEYWK